METAGLCCLCLGTLILFATLVTTLNLTILHTIDVHARFEETDARGGRCSPREAREQGCFGGVARRAAQIRALRTPGGNSLLLDAGNAFQGTDWFSYYGGNATRHFMELMDYDAMTLGYSEFLHGSKALAPFISALGFPVLSCNINVTQASALEYLVRPSAVFSFAGEKVGVVGVTELATMYITDALEGVVFMEEEVAVRLAVDSLLTQGINKIIVLSHAGYAIDKRIAENVDGVDVVVGGQRGNRPSTELVEGSYPTLLTRPGGRGRALVAHVQGFGKYLGMLDVSFDQQGHVIGYGGNPILLDHSVSKDPVVEEEVVKWRQELHHHGTLVLGKTNVLLEGSREHCCTRECNMGNVITDALVAYSLDSPPDTGWGQASIAMWNSGGIKASITRGRVTSHNVEHVLPYDNKVTLVQLRGDVLLQVLEHSASCWQQDEPCGHFLQYSGVQVTYNLSQPSGKRVVHVKVRCRLCPVPQFLPLDLKEFYNILTSDYLAAGGDGFSMIRYNASSITYIESLDIPAVWVRFDEDFGGKTDGGFELRNVPLRRGIDGNAAYFSGASGQCVLSPEDQYDPYICPYNKTSCTSGLTVSAWVLVVNSSWTACAWQLAGGDQVLFAPKHALALPVDFGDMNILGLADNVFWRCPIFGDIRGQWVRVTLRSRHPGSAVMPDVFFNDTQLTCIQERAGTSHTTGHRLHIGCANIDGPSDMCTFNGAFDDFRIYPRYLDDMDIFRLTDPEAAGKGVLASHVLQEYVRSRSPLIQGLEGRIVQIVNVPEPANCSISTASMATTPFLATQTSLWMHIFIYFNLFYLEYAV